MSITIADDDHQIVVLEITKPGERYVRCVVDCGTQNAVLDDIVAIQILPNAESVTHTNGRTSLEVTSTWHESRALRNH